METGGLDEQSTLFIEAGQRTDSEGIHPHPLKNNDRVLMIKLHKEVTIQGV